MTEKKRSFEDLGTGAEMRLFRENLGLPKYRKTRERNPEKRRLLLDLWLRKIQETEREDFISIGPRRRQVRIS